MQQVKVSQKLLNSLEFNTLLSLEEAKWYTQNEGFIPLPRKSDKKNLYVIFSNEFSEMFIALKKKNIKKYRISRFITETQHTEHYIVVLELNNSSSTNYYFYGRNKIFKEKDYKWFEGTFHTDGYDYVFTFIKH